MENQPSVGVHKLSAQNGLKKITHFWVQRIMRLWFGLTGLNVIFSWPWRTSEAVTPFRKFFYGVFGRKIAMIWTIYEEYRFKA